MGRETGGRGNIEVSIKEKRVIMGLYEIMCVKLFFFFLNLFLAVLSLRFCVWAFSSCGERGLLFIAVHGPLTIAASLVAEHRLQTHRLSNCG